MPPPANVSCSLRHSSSFHCAMPSVSQSTATPFSIRLLQPNGDVLERLAAALSVAQRVIVLAGAGISTSAGIPVSEPILAVNQALISLRISFHEALSTLAVDFARRTYKLHLAWWTCFKSHLLFIC